MNRLSSDEDARRGAGRPAASTFTRYGALAAAAGAALFPVGTLAAGARWPGYDPIRQMISELGGRDAPRPWIQNANFLMLGTSVVLLAAVLAHRERGVHLGAVLWSVLGLSGTAAEGLVHCDSGCQPDTTQGTAHLVLGMIGFVSGVVALWVLARRWRLRGEPLAGHARLTQWCAWAATGGLVAFLASGSPALLPVAGAIQRGFVAVFLVWQAITGYRLFRGHRTTPRTVLVSAHRT